MHATYGHFDGINRRKTAAETVSMQGNKECANKFESKKEEKILFMIEEFLFDKEFSRDTTLVR